MSSEKKETSSQKLELLEETQDHKIYNCPECGSKNFQTDHETGEKACTDCGLVVAQKMVDRGPEWRAFDAEQRANRTRVGAPSTYTIHDKGLSP